jgi:hypothetical protein
MEYTYLFSLYVLWETQQISGAVLKNTTAKIRIFPSRELVSKTCIQNEFEYMFINM